MDTHACEGVVRRVKFDVAKGELTTSWLNCAITAPLTKGQALDLSNQLRDYYTGGSCHCGSEGVTHETN